MTARHMSLAALQPGDTAVVIDVLGQGAFRRRLLDMGFVGGAPVSVIKCAPLMNPIEYSVRGTHVTLRRKEAMHIVVEGRSVATPLMDPVCRRGRHHLGHDRQRVGSGRGKRRRWWRRRASE